MIDFATKRVSTTTPEYAFEIVPHPSPTPADVRQKKITEPGFGSVFTDHMALIHWSEDQGWHGARITARAPFQIDPASSVLHYSQEIFEGMKAYRAEDGRILLFRPIANAQRLIQSAKRLSMPELPTSVFLEAVRNLVRSDHAWIPNGPNSSLYIRPFMFANEPFLGVRPARQYIFCVIASPVELYFGADKAVSVWLETEYSRAGPGGTGAAKCGGNYAASLLAQANAYAQGCDQVLFLDTIEHKWVEELGGMNVFFVMDDGQLITPSLSGTILPGITRDSILILAREMGLDAQEGAYSFAQLQSDAISGKLREVFACGTAAVVTSIGRFKYQSGEIIIGGGEGGEVTKSLRRQLVGLQRGEIHDKYQWVEEVSLRSSCSNP